MVGRWWGDGGGRAVDWEANQAAHQEDLMQLKPRKNIIVAVDPQYNIGKNNTLPWPRCPEDMYFFREMTMGSPVIMGSKTYNSLPTRSLPGRHLIVISRAWQAHGNAVGTPTSVQFVGSYEKAMEAAELRVRNHRQPAIWLMGGASVYLPTIWIAGGASVYRQAIADPEVTSIVMTMFPTVYGGDKQFPRLDPSPTHRWVHDQPSAASLVTRHHGELTVTVLRKLPLGGET